jgi:hypothetical protein
MRWRRPAEPAGSPNTFTLPALIFCTPTMQRSSVVLPLPLGPSRPVTLPRGTAQVSPGSTRRLPRSTTRSVTSIADSMAPPGTHQVLNSTLDEICSWRNRRMWHDVGSRG